MKTSVKRLQQIATTVPVGLWAMAGALMMSPVAAWADDDDKPMPIDPNVAAAQNRTLGVIAGLIVLAIVWYYVRRWQILRSGVQVHGEESKHD